MPGHDVIAVFIDVADDGAEGPGREAVKGRLGLERDAPDPAAERAAEALPHGLEHAIKIGVSRQHAAEQGLGFAAPRVSAAEIHQRIRPAPRDLKADLPVSAPAGAGDRAQAILDLQVGGRRIGIDMDPAVLRHKMKLMRVEVEQGGRGEGVVGPVGFIIKIGHGAGLFGEQGIVDQQIALDMPEPAVTQGKQQMPEGLAREQRVSAAFYDQIARERAVIKLAVQMHAGLPVIMRP